MRFFQRTRRDEGFTLPELLIAIVITGVIVSAVAGSFIVVLRNHDAQTNRLSTSHDANLLSSQIWSDVQSADTVVTSLPACPGGTAVSNGTVLQMSWRDWSNWKADNPVSTITTVSYAADAGQLTRTYQAAGGTATQSVVVHSLVDVMACSSGSKVTLTVKTDVIGVGPTASEPYTFAVSGTRRVAEAVRPVAATSPGDTGGTGDTHECTLAGVSVSPAAVELADTGGSAVTAALQAVVSTTGDCAGKAVSLIYQYGGIATVSPPLTGTLGGSSSWAAAFGPAAPSGGKWTATSKLVTAKIGSQSTTTSFTVNPFVACSPTAVRVDPGTVALAGSNAKNLAGPVSVAVDFVGACTGKSISGTYQYNGNNTGPFNGTVSGPSPWTTTIDPAAPSSSSWTTTTPRTVTATLNGTLKSTSFIVTQAPACAIGTVTVSPSSIDMVNKQGTALTGQVTATVTFSGGCDGAAVSVTYDYGVNGGTTLRGTISGTITGSTPWVAVIGPNPPSGSWTQGSKTVKGAIGSTTATTVFQVTQSACVASSLTVTPPSVGLNASSGHLSNDLSFSFTTTGTCGALSVRYQYDASNTATVAATRSGNTWTAAVGANDRKDWTKGTKSVSIDGLDAVSPTATFGVT